MSIATPKIAGYGLGFILALIGLVVTVVLIFTRGFSPELGLFLLAFLAILL